MKKQLKLFGMGAVLLILVFSLTGRAVQSEQSQEEQMEAYMKMMAPGENHAFLKKLVGEWTVETTSWMQPGAEPTVTQNAAVSEMMFGGRFLKSHFKGTMMGMPFEGIQIIGFDTFKKKITSLWIDSSSTFFYMTEGKREGNKLVEMGEWPDPMTGGYSKVKIVTTLVGQDEYTFEMYMLMEGQEFRSMLNRYTRKK
jgi:hypothetical protein